MSGIHIGALDGVRGVAIVCVLVYHYSRDARRCCWENEVLASAGIGWMGVDLFFVLSGFLITGILYDSRRSQNYFRNFYARRALRIFPLYYGAILFIVALRMVWPDASAWGKRSELWVAAYLTNVIQAAEGTGTTRLLTHFWSLAVEEHFYLLWPLIVLFGSRNALIVIAAALGLTSFGMRVALVNAGVDSYAIYVLTPTRLDSLAAGAICSLAVRGPGGISALVPHAWMSAIICGSAFILLMIKHGTVSHYHPSVQTIGHLQLAVAFGGAILIGLTWKPLNTLLTNSVLRWFGRYSYGLYVWHYIINWLLFYTVIETVLGVDEDIEHVVYFLFAFVMTLLVALASYHFWERPFLRLKRHFE